MDLMKMNGLIVIPVLLSFALLNGRGATAQKPECTADIAEDKTFGAAEIDICQEDFLALGFQLGDSVDLTFSNGFELTDVPFFNGYYVKTGQPVLVAYPGFEKISVTYNNEGIWQQCGFSQGDRITISLNTAGKYSTTQEALGQSYSTDRSEYDSDIAFVNFRSLSGGKLKENTFFRGASPVNNSRGRAAYADRILETNNIRFVMDLADSAENLEEFVQDDDFNSPYTYQLYEEGRVALLGMSSSYGSEKFQKSLAEGLRLMMENEGPVYIHCLEGKDRTGFVCMLLEALSEASYEEMLADYMLTYSNYYGISLENTPDKYYAVADLYFNAFVEYLHGTDDIETLKNADYSEDARAYLREAGMNEEEIDVLYTMLTE